MSERDIVDDLREGATVLDEWCHRESVAHTMLRAADEIERLRSAPGETEASVPTRTPEHGSSCHDGTEALRKALEEIASMNHEYGCSYSGFRGTPCTCHVWVARRALSQHVGGEG